MFSPLDGAKSRKSYRRIARRVIAAIRITSVRWRSFLPLKTQNLVLVDPAFVALRFELRDLVFIGVVFVPRGPAKWPARVDSVRWILAIGNWQFGPSTVMKKGRCRKPKFTNTMIDGIPKLQKKTQNLPMGQTASQMLHCWWLIPSGRLSLTHVACESWTGKGGTRQVEEERKWN